MKKLEALLIIVALALPMPCFALNESMHSFTAIVSFEGISLPEARIYGELIVSSPEGAILAQGGDFAPSDKQKAIEAAGTKADRQVWKIGGRDYNFSLTLFENLEKAYGKIYSKSGKLNPKWRDLGIADPQSKHYAINIELKAEPRTRLEERPQKPAFVYVCARSNSVYLSWAKVAGCNGYAVYVSRNISGPYELLMAVPGKNTSNCVINGLENKLYYFRVVSYKNSGAKKIPSVFSGTVAAVPY